MEWEIVIGIEEDYKKLSNLSFKKGNPLQSLVHALQLRGETSSDTLIEDVNKLHIDFKTHKIKTNSSQILVFALVAGLELSIEDFVHRLLMAMDDQLDKKNVKRLRSLHKSAIMLQIIHDMYAEKENGSYNKIDEVFISATVMLMLTSYLYRERLV